MRWGSVCIHNVSETMNLGIRKIKKAGIQQTACFIYTIKTLLSLMKDTGQRSIHIDYQERQLTQENWQMVLIQGNAVPSHG